MALFGNRLCLSDSQLSAKFYFLSYLKIETNKFISINKLKVSYDYVIRKDY